MAIDTKPLSILICGAGVAGITAALECRRRGFQVRILERSDHNVTTGDSFTVGPSGMSVFRHYPKLKKRSEEVAWEVMPAYHNLSGQRLLGPVDLWADAKKAGEKIPPLYRHQRPDFHAVLLEELKRQGMSVEYGKGAVEYFDDAEKGLGGVVLTDGTKLLADLVIAADGVRTASWELVLGHPVPAKSSGSTMFRAAYPVELALKDPETAERFPARFDNGKSIMELWQGPVYTVSMWRNERWFNWTLNHPDTETADESWSHKVDPEEVLKYTAQIPEWPEYGNRIIKATPPDRLVDYKLMWRDPQPKWTSPSGHVVQIGDSAHTFLPSSGNGATQAMEDATSLAACLSLTDDIPEATRAHNLLRFERVSCLQAFGIINAWKRDTRHQVKDEKSRQVQFGRWIWQHDAEDYVLKNFTTASKALREGTPFENTNIPPGLVYKSWTIDGLREALDREGEDVMGGDWS